MNLLLRSAVALALALILSNAEAAGTSRVTVSATATPAYTDLGVAPVWVSVVSPQAAQVIVADTIPTAGAQGSPLSGYVGPQVMPAADSGSHVWAAALPNSSATIFYSPASLIIQGNASGVPVPVTGTFSASFAGFTPTPAYASLAAGASSARVGLPAGTVVIVENMGANPACVLLGNSSVAATSSGALCTASDFLAANSWMALTVGSNTNIAAIDTSAGASSLMVSGGNGLPTGAGGGGGGGGGGGVTSSVAVTPTETASSAYVAGNEVGGLMTFSSAVGTAGSGVIESLHVVATSVQTTGLKLYLFTANPSSTTWTDKTTPSINSADVPKLIGVYALSFPDNGLGTMTAWNLDGVQKAFAGASGGFLYGVLVCTATPTFTTTTDLTITISDLEN